MIKKVLLFAVIAAFFASCSNTSGDKNTQIADNSNAEPVAITIEEFLAAPDSYVGKQVQIEGTAVHVCRETGKRMFIIGQDPDERIQVKAGEAIPSFAVELEGSDVQVAGLVDELRIDEAYLTQWENEVKADNPESDLKVHGGEEGHMAKEGDPTAELEQIQNYRNQIAESGSDHISFYSIVAKDYQEKK